MKAVRSRRLREGRMLGDRGASEISLSVHVCRQKDKMLGDLALDEQGRLHARREGWRTDLWDISLVSGGGWSRSGLTEAESGGYERLGIEVAEALPKWDLLIWGRDTALRYNGADVWLKGWPIQGSGGEQDVGNINHFVRLFCAVCWSEDLETVWD